MEQDIQIGLVGDEIMYEGQIIRVADEFDAITSKRQYKTHIGVVDTLKILIQNSKPGPKSKKIQKGFFKVAVGKNNKKIVQKLIEIVAEDTEYEIYIKAKHLEHIKNELGLPKSYDKLCNLKDRVMKPSLNEITTNTDIELTYENVKKGRSVVGFKFIVKEKPKPKLIAPQRDQRTIDMFCNLSDAQINKYSTILSKLSELSDLSNFPDYPTFALWISGILRDPKSVREEITKRIFKALHSKTDFKP